MHEFMEGDLHSGKTISTITMQKQAIALIEAYKLMLIIL
jgi:hypothetical protein